ncbi:uncharacterized protein aknad1 [Stigmatopora argus]
MEGEPKNSEDKGKTTLLRQKRFRQRIVMDLSEDESLHLSDLPTKTNKLLNENLLNQENEQSAQNTSDEDHEDLPYDGHLQSPYFNPTYSPQMCKTSDGRQTATNEHSTLHRSISDAFLVKIGDRRENKMDERARATIDMNEMLLRHFSQEELLQSGRLIEAETLPEVSLLESSDDLLCNTSTKDDSAPPSDISERPAVETCYSDGASKREHLDKDGTSSGGDVTSVKAPTKCEECEVPIGKVSHLRSRSFSELKYGQGQVHYPLPDFSKVAPKVKIPKGPSHPVSLLPQVPNPIIRAQSSPGMLEVISRVLEDSDLHSSAKPQVLEKTHEQTSPTLAEYDKLLAKYVRAENLIDKMRLGTNASSEFCMEADRGNSSEGSHVESAPPIIPTLGNIDEKENPNNQNEMKSTEEDGISEAEKMAAELRAVISQFMQSVDDFKRDVNNMSVSVEEQQMIVRSLMETQDQLERKYMSKKEEHRALEMQNYLGLCRNIGTFDANRLVEGDIFRVGMHLEDIKEMIDKNRREHINSPLLSTAQEITTKRSVQSLPPLLLNKESSTSWTTECFRMETMAAAQKEDEDDVGQNDGLEERSEIRSNDSMQVSNGFSVCVGVSKKGLLGAGEDEDNYEDAVYLEEIACSGKWSGIRGRSGTPDEVLKGERHLGDGVCLPVEGVVCRETDSGFGSSYLNQSCGISQPTPTVESQHLTNPRSAPKTSHGLTTSDSEGSSIHPTAVSTWRRASPVQTRPETSSTTVQLWVQNTAKESSLTLQGPLAKDHPAPEAILSSLMDADPKRGHACHCNSEAILALQVQVSKLRKDLEKGLFQLPYLTRKLEDLNSKYRKDGQERRTTNKTRSLHKPAGLWKSSSRQSVSRGLRREDWIVTDMDQGKSKGTASSADSSDTASCSERRRQVDGRPVAGKRVIRKQDSQESLFFKDRWSLDPPQAASLRPLLQVNYGSSCSLPACYKVKEATPQVSKHRKRSTQSDTALLPSNVYFLHTNPRNRTESQEEEMLDQAIDAARHMKRTTDRLAKRLTADLAKMQPLPRRNGQNSATLHQFTQRGHGIA